MRGYRSAPSARRTCVDDGIIRRSRGRRPQPVRWNDGLPCWVYQKPTFGRVMKVTSSFVGTTIGDQRLLFFLLYEAYNDPQRAYVQEFNVYSSDLRAICARATRSWPLSIPI